MAFELAHRLFTVDDYYRMAEAGILHEDDRVELIEGEIIEMPPTGSFHASVVDEIIQLFAARLTPDQARIRVQSPVRLSDLSEPQPDVTLLRPRPDRYRQAHPRADDVLLLIEVADSSAPYNRQVKLPLYAKEGIAEVWIVDLSAESVEVYRRPDGERYLDSSVFPRGESVSPAAFPELKLPVDSILG